MRENVARLFLFVLCVVMVSACASAPYKTSMQLNPEPGKATLGPQELDQAYEAAVATGLDLGYKVVSASREQRVVSLSRFRMADMVSETLKVDVENKGATAPLSTRARSRLQRPRSRNYIMIYSWHIKISIS